MAVLNTETSWGAAARALHWLTALLVLTAIPLGLLAGAADLTSDAGIERAVRLFSLHKTLGIVVLSVTLARIALALSMPRPVPVHPERRNETALAAFVHHALYAGLVVVPLAGWIGHAASTGYAPVLLPFGDELPFVPRSETLAAGAFAVHRVVTKVLAALVLLHVAGALKHAMVDRDGTLARMVTGRRAGDPTRRPSGARLPLVAASVFWLGALALGAGVAALAPPPAPAPAQASGPAPGTVLSASATLAGAPVDVAVGALILPDPAAVLGQGSLDADLGGTPLRVEIVRAPDGDLGLGSYGGEAIELDLSIEHGGGETTLRGRGDTAAGALVFTIVTGTP